MWRSLGLALALCLLPMGGTESQGQSSLCKQPPAWNIGDQDPMLNSSGSVTVVALLQKEGYSSVSYVVVNHQGLSSRLKYIHLKNKVSEHIPVYQQEEHQTDVWTLLNGNKDDFLIYDRCGRLVYHLGLPYSFLTFPYVEEAIKIAYCENKCGNCSLTTLENEDFCKNVSLATVEKTTEAPQPHHHHRHHHHHGHRHLGSSELSENQQPGAPDAPTHHAPPLDLRHHRKHKGQHRQGNPESSEGLQLAQKKLCQKGCKNQLLCKLPKDSELDPRSCCCHCRHLIFEKAGSCKENLPSLCKEKVIESCQ
uniref:Selenoprotein P n=1 Tax=Propithecus coquereli TaxID=379532 RepID=A0A2K6EXU7_PROCO